MTVRNDRHGLSVQAARPYTSQSVVIGAASAVSTAFSTNFDRPQREQYGGQQFQNTVNHTQHVRVVATVPCWIAFGTAAVAVVRAANSVYIPAGLPEYFWVIPGEQIAVIQDSGGGFLYISELFN
jgi:hypothetical protein